MSSEQNWLFIFGALLLIGGGGLAVYNMTRGLRNNNPLNLEDFGDDWTGLDNPRNDAQGPTPMFRFTDPIYGIRAGKITLQNYVAHDGIPPTVDALIRHFSETDQDAYVANVARAGGVSPDQPLNLPADFSWMIPAMITQENGINPYSADTIAQGLALA